MAAKDRKLSDSMKVLPYPGRSSSGISVSASEANLEQVLSRNERSESPWTQLTISENYSCSGGNYDVSLNPSVLAGQNIIYSQDNSHTSNRFRQDKGKICSVDLDKNNQETGMKKHLFFSHSNQTIASMDQMVTTKKLVTRNTNSSSVYDFPLMATDPKNVLSADLKSTSIFKKPPLFSSSFPSSDIIEPTLPKVPLAGLDVQANLPSVGDPPSALDLNLVSPNGDTLIWKHSMKPPVTPTLLSTSASEHPNVSSDIVSSISELSNAAVRLTPETLYINRPGPSSLRLLPSPAKTTSNILSFNNSSQEQEIQLMPNVYPAQLRLVPSRQSTPLVCVGINKETLDSDEPLQLNPNSHVPVSLNAQKTRLVPEIHMKRDAANSFIAGSVSNSISDLSDEIPMSGKEDIQLGVVKRFKVEQVTCFKCSGCGFLGTTREVVHHHISINHDVGLEHDASKEWQTIAHKEGINLHCPFCPNTFSAEGSHSFKAHVIHDHDQSNEETELLYQMAMEKRRLATLDFLQRRNKSVPYGNCKYKEDRMEAYVDPNGVLRVRQAFASSENNCDVIDVTADEYVDGILRARKDSKSRKITISHSNESSSLNKALSPDSQTKDSFIIQKKKRMCAGRPRGSKTTGITKVKRLNPNIILSDQGIGSRCQIEECAVRLPDASKLDYHRRSHCKDSSNFQCIECHSNFDRWSKLALHLWRSHKMDLGLYSCDECTGFRCYTAARLASHKVTHKNERPFLCDNCGKGFKTDKNLKSHKLLHRSRIESLKSDLRKCAICSRTFRQMRLLKLHMDSVHKKLKPHLCNFCGHSASSKSSLKMHLRLHTGEKPYTCDSCDYRTADHNSLRRHKLRHSGEKPYKCPHCKYSCIQASTYKVHLKNKHPDHSDKLVFNCKQCHFRTVKKECPLCRKFPHTPGEA